MRTDKLGWEQINYQLLPVKVSDRVKSVYTVGVYLLNYDVKFNML